MKTLPYSSVARILVEYSDSNRNVPSELFIKLTPGSINDSHALGIGKVEVEFYTQVAPAMSCPPLVRCFDAAYSTKTGNSHILMEDLSNTHSQPRQNRPPSKKLTRSAIETLARAHSEWWNNPQRGESVGKLCDRTTLKGFVEILVQSVTAFLENSGVNLTVRQRDSYDLMLRNAETI
jgi:hypothetical protein